jgi:hypothetical protein
MFIASQVFLLLQATQRPCQAWKSWRFIHIYQIVRDEDPSCGRGDRGSARTAEVHFFYALSPADDFLPLFFNKIKILPRVLCLYTGRGGEERRLYARRVIPPFS